MNLRWKLLAACAATAVVGIGPATAHEGHATAVRRCDLSASSTSNVWSGQVRMTFSDPNAVTVNLACWLRERSGAEVPGTRTTCATAGSAAGASGTCEVAIAFEQPETSPLEYCIDETWTDASNASHHYVRCTRTVNLGVATPQEVQDALAPFAPAPRSISVTAGTTGTGTIGNTGGPVDIGPVYLNVGPITLQA